MTLTKIGEQAVRAFGSIAILISILLAYCVNIHFTFFLILIGGILISLNRPSKGENLSIAIDNLRSSITGDDTLPAKRQPSITVEWLTRIIAGIILIIAAHHTIKHDRIYVVIALPVVIDFAISWKKDFSLLFPILRTLGFQHLPSESAQQGGAVDAATSRPRH